MVVALVERATSEKLKEPDWGINIEICDILKQYPRKAMDVVESLRKQLGSKNPMVQCLAIILLDSLLKNCADIVHTQVAQKHIYLEIAKIGTKKANAQVLDNLQILARTWEEVYGHTEHAGTAFSQISGWSSHTTAPTQTHPLTSDARNPRQVAGSAADSYFQTLSRTEIQNVHGTMDVLAEMLNALDPKNKEELKQDVIVDLVEQCCTYKQRMIDLVNASSDEEIIRKGLALNDDLQLILAKHAAIASGTFVQVQSLLDVSNHASATIDITKHGNERSSSSASGASQPPTQLQLPARPTPSGSITPKVCVEPLIDLLSGEDYSSPTADDALAIVPVAEPQPTSPLSQHKMLALPDMFSETSTMADPASSQAYYPVERTCFSSPPQFQKKLHSSQTVFYSNGSSQKVGLPLHEESVFTHVNHANPTWNVQVIHQDLNQEQQQPYYGGVTVQSSGTMPPPPWEPHPADDSQLQPMQVSQMMITNGQQMNSGIHLQSMGNDKVVGMFIQPITKGHLASMHNQQPFQSNQLVGIPRPVQGSQMVPMLPHPLHGGGQLASVQPETIQINQFAGCDKGIGPQFLEQSIHALSDQDDNTLKHSSYPMPIYSSQGQNNPFNKDKMFGDIGHGKVGPSETHFQ